VTYAAVTGDRNSREMILVVADDGARLRIKMHVALSR
jgi:hypothetical protein